MGYSPSTKQDNQEKTKDKQRQNDVRKTVVTCQHITIRAHESQTPFSARHCSITYNTGGSVNVY